VIDPAHEYLRRKVELARADKANGRSFSNEEIEAEFSAARDELARLALRGDPPDSEELE